jgi:cytochrome P450
MTDRTLVENRPSPAARPQPLPKVGLRQQFAGISRMRNDPVPFLRELAREQGDIATIPMLGFKLILLNHPDFFEHVLVRNADNYDKDTFLFHAVDPVLRGGLIGNYGGEPWRRQRRIMSPSFHQPQVAGFATNMTDQTSWLLRRWETQYGPDDVVNVSSELGQLAMRIVFGALFGADISGKAQEIEDLGLEANGLLGKFFRFPFPPLTWPSRRNRRLAEIVTILDQYVADVVAERNRTDEEHHDLLEALLNATDEVDGRGMSQEQLKREVLNLIVGGYETTSNSVSWMMYLVGKHPEVQARVQDEVDTVLNGRVPTFEDVPKLLYTRRIVDETQRMFTPAWQTMRNAIAEDEIGGYHIPARSNIYLNLYLLHRNPEFWPDPDVFEPDRFRPQEVAKRPRSAYLPFGAGPRNCIGKHFARTELTLIMSMIAQAYRITVPPEYADIQINPLITLAPKGGVHLRMQRR